MQLGLREGRVERVRSIVPGLGLAMGVAAAAVLLSSSLPALLGPVLTAVLLGLVVGNLLRLPPAVAPGLGFSSRTVLRVGVVLLGARLTFADLVGIGGSAIWVVLVTMTTALTTVLVVSRAAHVSPRLATLIGVGTAVCGNSAIMATAPVIDAEEREVGFAVATITVFGTAALLGFPMVAAFVEMPDRVFGFWAGLSINDTSQVVAAAAAYSEEALEVATVVKLVRNTLMAPLILLIAWWSARQTRVPADAQTVRGSTRKAFPGFVLGFLALAVLRSINLVGDRLAEALGQASSLLIAVAIAAVGLSTRLTELRRIGPRPFVVGLGAASVLAAVGLAFAKFLGS